MNTVIRLGEQSHCCACAQVCYHIGPIQLCVRHDRQETPPVVVVWPVLTYRERITVR